MKRALAVVWLALSIAAGAAAQAEEPVVVELYTSQGCSSCPPADAMLTELAQRDDIVALALHVDYWDYIGWEDPFGDPAHTMRQKAYARAANARTIYTPQMVIGGVDHVVGARPMQVMELIEKHKERPRPVSVEVARQGESLEIALSAGADAPGDMVVDVVSFQPDAVTEITRGENSGRTLKYSNIVTAWNQVATWDGKKPIRITVEIAGPVAVLVQQAGPGPILAAASLE